MCLLEAPEKNLFLVSSNLLTSFKVLLPCSRSTAHHLQSLLLPQPSLFSDLSLPSWDDIYTLYGTLPDDPGDSPYLKTLHLVMCPESSYPFWAREYDMNFFGRCWSASHTIETLWDRCLSPVLFMKTLRSRVFINSPVLGDFIHTSHWYLLDAFCEADNARNRVEKQSILRNLEANRKIKVYLKSI